MTQLEISPSVIKRTIDVYKRAFDSDMRLETNLIKKYIKNKIYNVHILTNDDTLVGFSFVIPLNKYSLRNIIHIDYIAIDPNHQGKGYATILMNKILSEYNDNLITLECENKLVKFYEKYGFLKKTEFQFKGKHMNFMIRGKQINICNSNRILSILRILQNPELRKSIKIIPLIMFIGNPTHSIGVIKIDKILYSKYDAWLRKHNKIIS